MNIYPRHLEVPALILTSLGVFLVSLTLPLMRLEKQFLWKHWQNDYSVITGIKGLWTDNAYALAVLLFFFSVVFPFVKLIALSVVWLVRLPETHRQQVLHWLEVLGRWSMLDVMVVAILIVLVKIGPLAKVEARSGVYVFATAILLSMLTTMYVDYLAKKKHKKS